MHTKTLISLLFTIFASAPGLCATPPPKEIAIDVGLKASESIKIILNASQKPGISAEALTEFSRLITVANTTKTSMEYWLLSLEYSNLLNQTSEANSLDKSRVDAFALMLLCKSTEQNLELIRVGSMFLSKDRTSNPADPYAIYQTLEKSISKIHKYCY